jgi:SAM-dependent methyltransferase
LLDTNGKLYATDLKEDMLAVAKDKIQDDRIHWQVVDAQELPYADQTFDWVVCQFGVMFFPDKIKAFQEALRVLKPGGTFLFLTWDDVAYNAISLETQFVLQAVFPEDPPVFFKKGPYSYFDKEAIHHALQDTGFRNIEIIPIQLTGIVSSIEDLLIGILDGSPLATYLQGRDDDKLKVREQLKLALSSSKYNSGESFHFPMQALYCKGMK